MPKKQVKSSGDVVHARMLDYQRTFQSESGKRVLRDLIDNHALLRSTYSGDVNGMLIKEGERNAVLRILTILGADPVEFLKRVKEIEEDGRSNDD